MKNGLIATCLAVLMSTTQTVAQDNDTRTHRQYLSGKGCDDMVQWDFFCTDGFNSGKWTKIGVPSCWETQGFGNYQYGMKFYGKAFPDGIADEKGKYKYEFNLPAEWAGRHIDLVFEAAMTDLEVLINHRKGGQKHHGGFYRVTYDVSDRVFFGDKANLLEVTVSKESENAGVNLSERRADYWNFGGLIRPVFIVSKPALNIERVAIDAKADGSFKAMVLMGHVVEGASVETVIKDTNGKEVGRKVSPIRGGSDHADIELKVNDIKSWTAETPTRYSATFTLKDKSGKALHVESEKFGFRTIETREGDGLYINGRKVLVKGVNRHSFRPETGRTLSYKKNLEDVLLMKCMNMNAVRLSHYPADPEFYDICDSLGMYVMDELTGWHGHHETINGQKLVKEMVTRDLNHPSIIWWSNGNEKGCNDELNGEFHKWDIQKRPVLHPQGNFGGYETMHYRSYGESNDYMRKPQIWMPTEFLHALYDGGAGAGLYDYWEVMRQWPRCAGGFIWALVDEGVVRTDMGGMIDNVGNYGADGIVGPHHEKEGSFFTVKQVWSPVQVFLKGHNFDGEKAAMETLPSDFDGSLSVENRYDFISLDDVKFDYEYLSFSGGKEKVGKKGTTTAKGIAARSKGEIKIPVEKDAEALRIKATDATGQEIFTWCFRGKRAESIEGRNKVAGTTTTTENDESLTVKAGKTTYVFSKKNGQLLSLAFGDKLIALRNGPQFFAYKRSDRSMDQFYNHDDSEAEKKKTTYTEYPEMGRLKCLTHRQDGDTTIVTAEYELGSMESVEWHISGRGVARIQYSYTFNGVVDLMGVKFDMDEDKVLSKEWLGMGPYRVWQNRLHGPQLGIWKTDYNDPIPGESFTYPEFKGYFAGVEWMRLETSDGTLCIEPADDRNDYVGVFQPRDGRDRLLYTLPETGLSIMQVIPAVRNKVNTTDLNGPSALPTWARGRRTGSLKLWVE